jgi:hypothetical protein
MKDKRLRLTESGLQQRTKSLQCCKASCRLGNIVTEPFWCTDEASRASGRVAGLVRLGVWEDGGLSGILSSGRRAGGVFMLTVGWGNGAVVRTVGGGDGLWLAGFVVEWGRVIRVFWRSTWFWV